MQCTEQVECMLDNRAKNKMFPNIYTLLHIYIYIYIYTIFAISHSYQQTFLSKSKLFKTVLTNRTSSLQLCSYDKSWLPTPSTDLFYASLHHPSITSTVSTITKMTTMAFFHSYHLICGDICTTMDFQSQSTRYSLNKRHAWWWLHGMSYLSMWLMQKL